MNNKLITLKKLAILTLFMFLAPSNAMAADCGSGDEVYACCCSKSTISKRLQELSAYAVLVSKTLPSKNDKEQAAKIYAKALAKSLSDSAAEFSCDNSAWSSADKAKSQADCLPIQIIDAYKTQVYQHKQDAKSSNPDLWDNSQPIFQALYNNLCGLSVATLTKYVRPADAKTWSYFCTTYHDEMKEED